ncbi:MAG: hypothetical protein R2800_15240 [Flavipsychrobacter sp.]
MKTFSLKRIKKAGVLLSRFWVFRKPLFTFLKYEHVIIEGNKLLLVSWNTKNASLLSIDQLGYHSSQKKSSLIISLPEDIDQVEILIKNLWKKTVDKISLVSIEIEYKYQINSDFSDLLKSVLASQNDEVSRIIKNNSGQLIQINAKLNSRPNNPRLISSNCRIVNKIPKLNHPKYTP